jgi:integrase
MAVYWKPEKGRWYFQFRKRIAGRQFSASKLLPKGWSRTQAEKYDRKECARLYALASGTEQPDFLIDDAIVRYIDEKCPTLANGKKVAQDLAHLIPYIEGRPFADLPGIFVEYAADHRDTLAPATIRNRLAYLRAAARYAFKVHRIGDADTLMRLILPTVQNYRTVTATQAEILKITNKLKAWGWEDTAALFTLARYTAQRWNKEVRILTRANISKVGKETWLTIGKTKNGEPNKIPVRDEDLWTLTHIPFDKVGQDTHYRRYKKAAVAIGRPDLWGHDLRRSFASELLSSGGSLDDVQIALNQKSRAAAERYAWADVAHKRSLFLGQKLHTTKAKKRVAK